jgi:hypothetical protein
MRLVEAEDGIPMNRINQEKEKIIMQGKESVKNFW